MTAIPVAIAEKLGKILPRLASDHEAEVLATVAAIRRTLAGANLDLNDLGQHLGNSGVPEFAASGFDWSDIVRPARDWAEAGRKAREASEPRPQPRPEPAKPKREPSPWPTFSSIRHFERCAWLSMVDGIPGVMGVTSRADFDALKTKIIRRSHEIPTRVEINLFNRLVRAAWAAGVRRERSAA